MTTTRTRTRPTPTTRPLDALTEGERLELMERLAYVLGVPADDAHNNEGAKAELAKALRDAIEFGFRPGVHTVMWSRDAGDGPRRYALVRAADLYRRLLDDFCRTVGYAFVQVEPVEDPAEKRDVVQAISPESKPSPNDKVFRARFIEAEQAKLHREMGWDFDPPWMYGVWRENAFPVGRKANGNILWQADFLPAARTAEDVARLRATKAAMMSRLALRPLDDKGPEERVFDLLAYLREFETPADRVEADAKFTSLPVGQMSGHRLDTLDDDVLFA